MIDLLAALLLKLCGKHCSFQDSQFMKTHLLHIFPRIALLRFHFLLMTGMLSISFFFEFVIKYILYFIHYGKMSVLRKYEWVPKRK